MSKPKNEPSSPRPETQGDFRPDGSWNPDADHGERWRLVDSLVSARRRHNDLSPAGFLAGMRSLGTWPMLDRMISRSVQENWDSLTHVDDWPRALVSGSADSVIKHEGRGPSGWHWQGCHCIPNAKQPLRAVHPPDCRCEVCRVWDAPS